MNQNEMSFRRDMLGAAMVVALGIVVIVVGRGYAMGTLTQMGAGYVPVALGVILIGVGVLMALTTRRSTVSSMDGSLAVLPEKVGVHPAALLQWRGWVCILAGVAAFVVLGAHGGLVPATFCAVFVSALGDRENSFRDAALLAVGVTIAGVLIFSWGLKLAFPLFVWN